jgi:hypothetical protein
MYSKTPKEFGGTVLKAHISTPHLFTLPLLFSAFFGFWMLYIFGNHF